MSEIILSVVMPARTASRALNEQLPKLMERLEPRFGSAFEVIVVANGFEGPGPKCLTEATARRLQAAYPQIQVIQLPASVLGKGRAVRAGVDAARGQWLLLLDVDLPFGLSPIDAMVEALQHGAEFVTSNRRLPESRFSVPTRLLHLAYRRHKVGLRFNRIVRLFFPKIPTLDTQAGLKALTVDFARAAFPRLTSPGFYYDIELFLIALAQKRRWREIPVTLHLDNETSTLTMFRELARMLYWIPRIWWQNRRRLYG